jgi:hypothetical protein
MAQAALAAAEEKPAAETPGVVYLQRSTEFDFSRQGSPNRGVLLREMARQALLLAARDELGLATRDLWLGDEMPSEGQNQPFEVATTQKNPRTLVVRRGFSPPGKLVMELQPKASPPPPAEGLDSDSLIDYAAFLAEMETLSRTKFVQALRQSGFQGRANPLHGEAAAPEDIEKRLGRMSFTSQFAALRRLHAQIHDSGESPARLGTLVRGYANLGMLTEFHWHPAHGVFAARSLLYAQRMVRSIRDGLVFLLPANGPRRSGGRPPSGQELPRCASRASPARGLHIGEGASQGPRYLPAPF